MSNSNVWFACLWNFVFILNRTGDTCTFSLADATLDFWWHWAVSNKLDELAMQDLQLSVRCWNFVSIWSGSGIRLLPVFLPESRGGRQLENYLCIQLSLEQWTQYLLRGIFRSCCKKTGSKMLAVHRNTIFSAHRVILTHQWWQTKGYTCNFTFILIGCIGACWTMSKFPCCQVLSVSDCAWFLCIF